MDWVRARNEVVTWGFSSTQHRPGKHHNASRPPMLCTPWIAQSTLAPTASWLVAQCSTATANSPPNRRHRFAKIHMGSHAEGHVHALAWITHIRYFSELIIGWQWVCEQANELLSVWWWHQALHFTRLCFRALELRGLHPRSKCGTQVSIVKMSQVLLVLRNRLCLMTGNFERHNRFCKDKMTTQVKIHLCITN